MPLADTDLEVYQADSFDLRFHFNDDDGQDPYAFPPGATIKFYVKSDKAATLEQALITVDGQIFDADNGDVIVGLPTSGLETPGNYRYLLREIVSGRPRTLMAGKLKVVDT